MAVSSAQKTFYIETFGCQMNFHDSEKVVGTLISEGYAQVQREEEADLIFYNTCSIRDKAEQKVFHRLTDFKKLQQGREALRRARLRGAAGGREDLRARAARLAGGRLGLLPQPAGDAGADRGGARAASPDSTTARPKRPSRPNSPRAPIRIADTSPSSRAATSSAPTAWCRTPAARSAAAPRSRCWRKRGAWPIAASPRFNCSGRT